MEASVLSRCKLVGGRGSVRTDTSPLGGGRWEKLLDGCMPVVELGLPDMAEVVFHVRARGGGFGGVGKGYNNGVPIPGEWTCTSCWAPHCWPSIFFVTGVTLPDVTLLQVLGPGVREVFRVWVLVVREGWVLG